MYDYAVLPDQVVFMKKKELYFFTVSFAELRAIQKENKNELNKFLGQYGIDSQELFQKMKEVE